MNKLAEHFVRVRDWLKQPRRWQKGHLFDYAGKLTNQYDGKKLPQKCCVNGACYHISPRYAMLMNCFMFQHIGEFTNNKYRQSNDFNDAPETKKKDVIKFLNFCIKKAKEIKSEED